MNYMSMHARLCDRDDQLVVLRAKLDERNEMIADLVDRHSDLSTKYDVLSAQYNTLLELNETAMQQAAAKRHELHEIELDLSKQLEALRAEYERLEDRYLHDTAAAGRVVDMLSDRLRELRSECDELGAKYEAQANHMVGCISENNLLRTHNQKLRTEIYELRSV